MLCSNDSDSPAPTSVHPDPGCTHKYRCVYINRHRPAAVTSMARHDGPASRWCPWISYGLRHLPSRPTQLRAIRRYQRGVRSVQQPTSTADYSAPFSIVSTLALCLSSSPHLWPADAGGIKEKIRIPPHPLGECGNKQKKKRNRASAIKCIKGPLPPGAKRDTVRTARPSARTRFSTSLPVAARSECECGDTIFNLFNLPCAPPVPVVAGWLASWLKMGKTMLHGHGRRLDSRSRRGSNDDGVAR